MITMNIDTPCLKGLMVHYVGSKNNLEPLHISGDGLELDTETMKLLQDGFLHKFKTIPEQYSFHHTSSLQFNEVYSFCRQLFNDAAQLPQVSVAIAKHLYEASTHPKVKGGELYVAYFEGLPVESRMHKGIGIFKTENKALYMDVQQRSNQFQLSMKEGVEMTKIDKGCLIINSREDEGYDVMIFDNQNRGEEAQYWKESFLGLTPQQNEFHHTNHFLTLTKQFITEQLDTELKIPKTEQVELLNRSIDYFKSKDSFDIEEFQTEVFANEAVIGSFRNFGSRYVEANDFDIASSFDISPQAVKKQSRVFKSVVKLDKNFHIYIHGRTDLIEKGVDMDGRKFYKIYYQDEA
ncbi:MAG: nucleoid-associated protein [Flavisolibacter sp.]